MEFAPMFRNKAQRIDERSSDPQPSTPRLARLRARSHAQAGALIATALALALIGVYLMTLPGPAAMSTFGAMPKANAGGTPEMTGGPDATGVPQPLIALNLTPPSVPTPGPTTMPAPARTAAPKPASKAPSPVPSKAPSPVPSKAPSPVPSKAPIYCGSLQGRIDAAAAGSTLRLSGCTYVGGATIGKSLTIAGGTLNVRAGGVGLNVTASNVTIEGMHIAGPNKTSYNSAEYGVYALGSASAPISHLTIRDTDIGSFGSDGIYAMYVANLLVSGNTIHDIVYAGILVYSGQGGRIQGNVVERIGVHGASANSNNAYGIALSDQGGAPTSDFVVTANTVQDIPTWHALDTHGGHRISFTDNTVRRASRGIFITTSSSSRATDVTVSGNKLLVPAPVTTNLEAVTTYNTVAVTITGNTITGWGGSTIEDYEGMSTDLVVTGNRVD
jgi:Right handed beta helix region